MTNGDPQELSPFIINFFGQVVTIITTQTSSSTAITDAGPIIESGPYMFQGILIDEDDRRYYLGKTINDINCFVDKDKVVAIEIFNEPDPYTEVLDQMPIPESKDEVN